MKVKAGTRFAVAEASVGELELILIYPRI